MMPFTNYKQSRWSVIKCVFKYELDPAHWTIGGVTAVFCGVTIFGALLIWLHFSIQNM